MLPGLRFVFTASLLAISMLVFGMGAIALLRASHQQVANLTAQPAPEPVFAQAPETVPSLSVLRAEPAAPDVAPIAADAGRLAAPTSALREVDTAPSSAPESPPAVETLPGEVGSQAASESEPKRSQTEPQQAVIESAPAANEPRSIPPASPVVQDVTGSTSKPAVGANGKPPIANPPVPQARPEIANRIAAASGVSAPKVVAVKKARKIKRRYVHRKRIPLTPVSSNPLSQLFGIASTRTRN